jgi:hypothetical protein
MIEKFAKIRHGKYIFLTYTLQIVKFGSAVIKLLSILKRILNSNTLYLRMVRGENISICTNLGLRMLSRLRKFSASPFSDSDIGVENTQTFYDGGEFTLSVFSRTIFYTTSLQQ